MMQWEAVLLVSTLTQNETCSLSRAQTFSRKDRHCGGEGERERTVSKAEKRIGEVGGGCRNLGHVSDPSIRTSVTCSTKSRMAKGGHHWKRIDSEEVKQPVSPLCDDHLPAEATSVISHANKAGGAPPTHMLTCATPLPTYRSASRESRTMTGSCARVPKINKSVDHQEQETLINTQ